MSGQEWQGEAQDRRWQSQTQDPRLDRAVGNREGGLGSAFLGGDAIFQAMEGGRQEPLIPPEDSSLLLSDEGAVGYRKARLLTGQLRGAGN